MVEGFWGLEIKGGGSISCSHKGCEVDELKGLGQGVRVYEDFCSPVSRYHSELNGSDLEPCFLESLRY